MRITKASKKILKNLESPLTIEAYFSEKVPIAYLQQVKLIKDFLKEYATVGGRNVRLVFLDPDKDSEIRMRAQNLGITPLSLGTIGENKQEVSNIYFSVVLLYQDKQQILPNILSVGMLEYQLTARTYGMANPQEQAVGLITGTGKFRLFNQQDPVRSLSGLDKVLSDFYGHIRPLTKEETEIAIPSQIKTLLLIEPMQLSEQQLFAIDQFLLQGNHLIVASSGMNIDFSSETAFPVSNALNDFFANYGFTIERNMVHEGKNILPLQQPVNAFEVQEIPMPTWIFLSNKNLNQDSLITKELPNLFLPWASNIHFIEKNFPTLENSNKKNKPIILAKSSNSSWQEPEGKSGNVIMGALSQRELYFKYRSGMLKNIKYQPSVMVAHLQGYFQSYFKNRLPLSHDNHFLKESSKSGNLLIISTPYALSDVGIFQGQNNFFLLNALDSINGLEDLVNARNSADRNPRLPLLPNWVKQTIVAVSFLFPLFLIVVLGFFIRNRRKTLAMLAYDGETFVTQNLLNDK